MKHRDVDPIDALREADPARSSLPPSDSKARVWARIEEVTMGQSTPSSRLRRFALGLTGAAAAAAVAVAVAVAIGSQGAAPAPSPDSGGVGGDGSGAAGGGMASCLGYELAGIADRGFAFDGEVLAVDAAASTVTFRVNEAFSGPYAAGEEVTLESTLTGDGAVAMDGIAYAGGERYLVSGDESFAWTCGWTQPYDAGVAADWAEVTP